MDRARAPRLSLDLLRGFRAAARHLSFTRAAQELFVTQGAISREVRTLEEQLGRPLFVRVNRRLELTPAGQDLLVAVEQGLGVIDAASARIAGASRALAVTTTVALASTWLVPRLPRFARRHPAIDMRFVASNDAVDLQREHIDVALRFVPAGAAPSTGPKLFDYLQFPVCAPALARDAGRPLREPADLARHVLLDFETVLYGRPWYDWRQWLSAQGLPGLKGVAWLRFSHYDQVIEAAIEGGGVAIGKLPHLTQHLREGRLVAPMGARGIAMLGSFHVERAEGADQEVVEAFVQWLHDEIDADPPRPALAGAKPAESPAAAAGVPATGAAARQNASRRRTARPTPEPR